jgi:hypothetical protein
LQAQSQKHFCKRWCDSAKGIGEGTGLGTERGRSEDTGHEGALGRRVGIAQPFLQVSDKHLAQAWLCSQHLESWGETQW